MISNQNQAENILQCIRGSIQQCENILNLLIQKQYPAVEIAITALLRKMTKLKEEGSLLKEEETTLVLDISCESIEDSLKHIQKLLKARSEKTKNKIEFEVIPLLEELYAHMRFRGCIYPNKNKIQEYIRKEKPKLFRNKYLERARETGQYKYELSIIVVAYNNVDITKQCVESILNNIPSGLEYELILVNHGSTDGTKEYFQTIDPTKQLDILRNGAGLYALRRIVEGRYQLTVSNDALIMPNAIENMLACIKSDEKIELVVPSTPNISNLQDIGLQYRDMQEMYIFAKNNNKQDPYRWEQRVRLCDPIALTKNAWQLWAENTYFDSGTTFSFPDDRISLIIRRSGYKMMLAKDAYCYHYGSLAIAKENNQYKDKEGNQGSRGFYLEGRRDFLRDCNVDPWGVGFCWSFELISNLPYNQMEHIDVLGINCGMGSNPLKVKEMIKENTHNTDVTIYNVTDDDRYLLDLQGVSDEVRYLEDIYQLTQLYNNKKFDYIIFEHNLDRYPGATIILTQILEKLLKEDGIIAFVTQNPLLKEWIRNQDTEVKERGSWNIITHRER